MAYALNLGDLRRRSAAYVDAHEAAQHQHGQAIRRIAIDHRVEPIAAAAMVQRVLSVCANQRVGSRAAPGMVSRLHRDLGAVMAAPEIVKQMANTGIEVRVGTPAEFTSLIRAHLAKWAAVVKRAGVQAE